MLSDHPIAVAALTRAVDTKTSRSAGEQVPEGTLANLDFTVRIHGTLQRSAGSNAKPTASLLNQAMVGELLRRLGVTREAALKHMREIAFESLTNGQLNVGKAFSDANPELLMAIKQVQDEVIAELPKQHKPGPIKAQVATDLQSIDVQQHGEKAQQ